MKVAIFTEDSGVKYPEIHRYKGTLGRGRNLEDIPGFLETLEKNDFDIPTDDLENEERYLDVFKDYVRPSILMFSGMFREVKGFCEEIGEMVDVDLYVISGRYGLVKGDEEVIPYDAYVDSAGGVKKLDKRTGFTDDIVEVSNSVDLCMFFMATRYIEHLLDRDVFDRVGTDCIVVSGKTMLEKIEHLDNVTCLSKRGVSRISWQNRGKIKERLKDL